MPVESAVTTVLTVLRLQFDYLLLSLGFLTIFLACLFIILSSRCKFLLLMCVFKVFFTQPCLRFDLSSDHHQSFKKMLDFRGYFTESLVFLHRKVPCLIVVYSKLLNTFSNNHLQISLFICILEKM